MLYELSLVIQERLDAAPVLLESGQYSTPALAKKVGVSIPTASRIVAALRQRGNDIRATKTGNAWHYILAQKAPSRRHRASATRKRSRRAIPQQSID